MKRRVFLTGASGYLGSVLVDRLAGLDEVEKITGLANRPPPRPWPPKAEFIQMDVRSPDLRSAMAGHDVVIHAAAIVLWSASMPAAERDDINLRGTRNVAEAALANHVARFIHASSMAAYDPILARGKTAITEEFPLGDGRSPFYYWNSKALAERILAEVLGPTRIVLTFFRPIYIVGPRCPTTGNYRKYAVRFPGANPRRQFIHEEDVADAFVLAIRREMPGAFNVVPDDFVRLNDVWLMAGAKFVPTLPLGLVRAITALRWRYLGSPIHPSWVEDMLVDFTGSNARLRNAGWRPRYTSAEAFLSALGGVRS
jgi:nucleoside-diphosphate-sugar epimerase